MSDAARGVSLPGPARTALRRSLLAWFDRNARDLPWRRTRDPYHILLSELLLQQTRVEAARPYYDAFLAAFPNVHALAAAPLPDVLKLWAGLGYYRRARHLHAAARRIVGDHDGRVPDRSADLLKLPGVGRYTAAAVASIAFGEPVAALDGNIKRVLARLFAVDTPIDDRGCERELWRLADALLARRRPGDFNQALMEIGATLCTPKRPRCPDCPLRRWCRAAREGSAGQLPRRRPKAVRPHIEQVAAAVVRRGRLLLVRRPESGLLAGMWELPGGPLLGDESPAAGLVRVGRERFGAELHPGPVLGQVEHVFTHRTTRITVLVAEQAGRMRPRDHTARGWYGPRQRSTLPIATLDRKVLALLAGEGADS